MRPSADRDGTRRTLRMDFAYTPEQVQVRELTERLCADFDEARSIVLPRKNRPIRSVSATTVHSGMRTRGSVLSRNRCSRSIDSGLRVYSATMRSK